MGHAELVEKIDGVDEPAEDFLDHLHEDYISRYDDTTFWLRLARELALRDIERYHPEMEDADDDGLDAMALPYMDKYLKEFAENYLNNLELTKPVQAD